MTAVVRCVLDTDVIVAAMRSPSGGSAAVLRLLDEGLGALLLTPDLMFEYEVVCQRPEHRDAAGLSVAEVDIFLQALADMAVPVERFFVLRPQLHDPDDEKVLEAAFNGRARALVTFNKRHYGDVPGRFGIEVFNPGEMLRRLRT